MLLPEESWEDRRLANVFPLTSPTKQTFLTWRETTRAMCCWVSPKDTNLPAPGTSQDLTPPTPTSERTEVLWTESPLSSSWGGHGGSIRNLSGLNKQKKKMLICFYFWYNNSSGSFLIFKVSSMHALSVKVKFPLMHRFLLMTPTFQGLRAQGGIFGFFQGISNSVWSLGYFCSLLNALLMEQTLASPQPTPTHCMHSLQQETQTGGGKIVQPWSTGLVRVRP